MDKTTQIDYKISGKDFISIFKDIINKFTSNKESASIKQDTSKSTITLEEVIAEEAKLGSTKRIEALLNDFNGREQNKKETNKPIKNIKDTEIKTNKATMQQELTEEREDR